MIPERNPSGRRGQFVSFKLYIEAILTSSTCAWPLAGQTKCAQNGARGRQGCFFPPPGSGSPTPPNLTKTQKALFPCALRAARQFVMEDSGMCRDLPKCHEVAHHQCLQKQREADKQVNQQACNQISLTKNLYHFSTCACHPCAGAMLIFSVSFQF